MKLKNINVCVAYIFYTKHFIPYVSLILIAFVMEDTESVRVNAPDTVAVNVNTKDDPDVVGAENVPPPPPKLNAELRATITIEEWRGVVVHVIVVPTSRTLAVHVKVEVESGIPGR